MTFLWNLPGSAMEPSVTPKAEHPGDLTDGVATELQQNALAVNRQRC
jgi:hypothetical protein